MTWVLAVHPTLQASAAWLSGLTGHRHNMHLPLEVPSSDNGHGAQNAWTCAPSPQPPPSGAGLFFWVPWQWCLNFSRHLVLHPPTCLPPSGWSSPLPYGQLINWHVVLPIPRMTEAQESWGVPWGDGPQGGLLAELGPSSAHPGPAPTSLPSGHQSSRWGWFSMLAASIAFLQRWGFPRFLWVSPAFTNHQVFPASRPPPAPLHFWGCPRPGCFVSSHVSLHPGLISTYLARSLAGSQVLVWKPPAPQTFEALPSGGCGLSAILDLRRLGLGVRPLGPVCSAPGTWRRLLSSVRLSFTGHPRLHLPSSLWRAWGRQDQPLHHFSLSSFYLSLFSLFLDLLPHFAFYSFS